MLNFIRTLFKAKEVDLNTLLDDIDSKVDQETKDYLIQNGYIGLHHSLGRWVRNTYALWAPESKAHTYMKNTFGLDHADDMSSIILGAYTARLRGNEYNPWPDVKRFKAHWAKYADKALPIDAVAS